jgi:protein TonB
VRFAAAVAVSAAFHAVVASFVSGAFVDARPSVRAGLEDDATPSASPPMRLTVVRDVPTAAAPDAPRREIRTAEDALPVELPAPDAVSFDSPVEAVSPPAPDDPPVAVSPPPEPIPSFSSGEPDVEAVPKGNIRPSYPESSRRKGEQGSVLIETVVGSDGVAVDPRVVRSSGFSALDEAAVRAVRKARFEPARVQGRCVPSTVRLPVRFLLTD